MEAGSPFGAAVGLSAIVAVDQLLKGLVSHFLPPGYTMALLPGVLALTHVRNPGIAFGLRVHISPLIPAAVALTGVFLLFYNSARWTQTRSARVALVLVSGGALGNLIDRLRVGAVIDYIDLHVWPVFNLADAAVTIGAVVFLLALVRGSR